MLRYLDHYVKYIITEEFLHVGRLVSSIPLFRKLPYFRRTHVSSFNICMSLFR